MFTSIKLIKKFILDIKVSAQKRVADPNWISPLKLISKERRAEIARNRKIKPISKYSKEQILENAKGCQSQNELAAKLGCTNANISHMAKVYNIRAELKDIFGTNLTKEKILEVAKECKLQKQIYEKLGYSDTQIINLIKKFNIKDEVKQILRQNKNFS